MEVMEIQTTFNDESIEKMMGVDEDEDKENSAEE